MIYTIENEFVKVQINSMGAELWSIFNKQDGLEHLWQGDKSIWPRRAPNLFPHCGKLKGDQFIHNGVSYKSTLHGFARDYEHVVVQQDVKSITFFFPENEKTLEIYPFKFHLYTRFQLDRHILTQSFNVKNTGEKEMYFSIGFHTGYRCPFDDKHSILDYSIVFDQEETPLELLCNKEGLLNGVEKVYFENQKVIHLNDKLFPSSFILSGLKSGHVSLVEADTGKYIKICIKDFPYTVFWSTPGKVKFVCVEPWYGLPDLYDTKGRLDKKPCIQKLLSGKGFSCAQTIEIGSQ